MLKIDHNVSLRMHYFDLKVGTENDVLVFCVNSPGFWSLKVKRNENIYDSLLHQIWNFHKRLKLKNVEHL